MSEHTQFEAMSEAQKLRIMIEATQAGSWEWNVQTGAVVFNERWAEMLGYTLDELKPLTVETWRSLAEPEDLKASTRLLEEHFNGASSYYECRIRAKHKLGHWVWLRDYGKLITRTNDGKPEWVLGTHIDITPLLHLQQKFETISTLLPGVVYQYQVDADGTSRFPFATEGLISVYGVRPEEVKQDASPVFEVIHKDDLDHVVRTISESKRYMSAWVCEYRVTFGNDVRWVFGHAKPSKLPAGGTLWTGMIIDITERKKLEIELEESRFNLKQAQKIARIGHWEMNQETGELYWSDMVYEILGFAHKNVKPSIEKFRELVHPDDIALIDESEKIAGKTGVHDVQHRMKHADGHYIWVHELAEFKKDGVILLGTLRDITKEKELENSLLQQSITDSLTGAFNRRHFDFRLKEEVKRSQRNQSPLSLLSFDLDHFKHVNDNYGHSAGDDVLKSIVNTVKSRLRDSDVFARIGGEEFAIILPDTPEDDAQMLAETLRAAIQALVTKTESESIMVTVTVGVTSTYFENESAETLLRRADKALYKGKQTGRNRVCVFKPEAQA
ncbi:diguanylate cyclase [Idiomarina sp. Sol25]|uniref:GGDEF domain-containing protein n=1 Tax=Idiomarina sp. Sol25 TaxID=3064000 RepID=UPI00294AE7A9|nr:diguanylate cyclase [Idiomarina sp. Sol25]MDV6327650.1 diguanylate cyclase [Idiomarina sp. Sol25]